MKCSGFLHLITIPGKDMGGEPSKHATTASRRNLHVHSDNEAATRLRLWGVAPTVLLGSSSVTSRQRGRISRFRRLSSKVVAKLQSSGLQAAPRCQLCGRAGRRGSTDLDDKAVIFNSSEAFHSKAVIFRQGVETSVREGSHRQRLFSASGAKLRLCDSKAASNTARQLAVQGDTLR